MTLAPTSLTPSRHAPLRPSARGSLAARFFGEVRVRPRRAPLAVVGQVLGLVALVVAMGCASGEGDDSGGSPDSGGLFSPDAPTGPGNGDDTPDAEPCITDPCDLYEQCGCGEDEACDVDSEDRDATYCRSVNEFGGGADSCESDESPNRTNCRPGFICLAGEPSFCRGFCQSDDDCPGAGGVCRIPLTDSDVVMCTFHCDASDTSDSGADNCPDGQGACRYRLSDDRYFTSCEAPGDAGHREPCDLDENGHSDCEAGHQCIRFESGTEQCRQTCVIGVGGCPAGEECRQREGQPTVGSTEYGLCRTAE